MREIRNRNANWPLNISFCLSQCEGGSLSRERTAFFQILTYSPVMTTFPCHETWVSYCNEGEGEAFRFLRNAGKFTPYHIIDSLLLWKIGYRFQGSPCKICRGHSRSGWNFSPPTLFSSVTINPPFLRDNISLIFHIYIFFATDSVFRESTTLCVCPSATASLSHIAWRYLAFTDKTMSLIPKDSVIPLCSLFSLRWHGCALATVVTRSLLILITELPQRRHYMLR